MLPYDYLERVYAGVLGKIIGVYLGRPFEGWPYERIIRELGEIQYYVNNKLGVPLIVTDDDISGTFTFIRALQDFGHSKEITPEQIGQTWLNYLIENRTVLWWGGLGNSTEHTAYLRLKRGTPAPFSGSHKMNGKTVSEQIGAQIFIDGWALVCPGDPEKAIDLARKAASVSHDGEAIFAAQVLAAMESLAFIENDTNRIIDNAVQFIPHDSVIYRLISDLREWHQEEPDWKKTRKRIEAYYGYDRYGGNCHVVPNHALIILGLLYGEDNFQKSLMITNTSGWDTDCNSGNLGCLLGIKNGLSCFAEGPDWRNPVADRVYIPTADGGFAINDAVIIAYQIGNIGRQLVGIEPEKPKNGARFHFEFPGSLQGFQVKNPDFSTLENVPGHSSTGKRSLKIMYENIGGEKTARVKTVTFIPPDAYSMPTYGIMASPTLYPGQIIKARVEAEASNTQNVNCRLYISVYSENDLLRVITGPEKLLFPGDNTNFEWETNHLANLLKGEPIAEVGLEILASENLASGAIFLDYMTWEGTPSVIFSRPKHNGTAWRRGWINAVDELQSSVEAYRLIQNDGTGFLIQGCQDWKNYQISADVTPHMVKGSGIIARFQGLQKYYAFMLCDDGKVKLIKNRYGTVVLAERNEGWRFGEGANLSLKVVGNTIKAFWDGFLVFDIQDDDQPLLNGSIGLIVEEGRTATESVSIFPVE